MFKKFAKCQDQDLKIMYQTNYKLLKNELSLMMKNSKTEFYRNYFVNHKQNLQKTWKGIKEIVNIKNKTMHYPSCINDYDKHITEPAEIAEKFNDYFASIADNILNDRKYVGNRSFNDFLKNRSNQTMALFHCDEIEVISLIKQLDPQKACGPNSIPTDMLQLLVQDISKPLTKICHLKLVVTQIS